MSTTKDASETASAVTDADRGTILHTLNVAAFHLGRLVALRRVDPDDAGQALLLTGRQIGLSDTEVDATIRGGLRAGIVLRSDKLSGTEGPARRKVPR
jgi:hypothetical protein